MNDTLITGYDNKCIITQEGTINIEKGEQLCLSFSTQRFCIGYKLPEQEPIACPQADYAQQGSQCLKCLNASATLACVRCIGKTCSNPVRRAGCVLSPHYVYLALYTPDLIKVGVTKVERLEMRIREQGALAAMVIAGEGGQEVRKIEHSIALAGWRDRTNLLPLLTEPGIGYERAHNILLKEQHKIDISLPVLGTMAGKYIWLGDQYPSNLSTPPRLLNPEKDVLNGISLGTRGNYLLFTEQHMLGACSLRSLVGRKLSLTDNDANVGMAQASLF